MNQTIVELLQASLNRVQSKTSNLNLNGNTIASSIEELGNCSRIETSNWRTPYAH